MPEILEAKFRIVTPMFLGGANQDISDGIRPPSVKGALRFWWRALNRQRFRAQAPDDAGALQNLHREEARLFGLAASDNGGGQGCFLLHTSHGPLKHSKKDSVHSTLRTKGAARYLGYGLMEAFASQVKGTQAGQLIRPCIDEGQEFTVQLRFRIKTESSVRDALIAWGLLGGLGSRARHGFGSVALLTLNRGTEILWSTPQNREDYQGRIATLLNEARTAPSSPPFTAVSQDTRIDILSHDHSSPFDTLSAFGYNLLMYRSWGRGGKVLGEDSEKNFPQDHDWAKAKRPAGFHPRRVVFGLPHNYGQGTNLEIKPANHERRASPLLFHVHPVGQHFLGASILLPAAFLPTGERINAGGTVVASNPDWTVLTDFLDGRRKADGKPRFSGKTTILGGHP